MGSMGRISRLLLFYPRGRSFMSSWGCCRLTVASKAGSCPRLRWGHPATPVPTLQALGSVCT